jgi:hypothetical protein
MSLGCSFLIVPSVFSSVYLIYVMLMHFLNVLFVITLLFEGAIKNEQPRDTGNTRHTRHRTNVQSRMNNPETLATLDTQDIGRRCNQE